MSVGVMKEERLRLRNLHVSHTMGDNDPTSPKKKLFNFFELSRDKIPPKVNGNSGSASQKRPGVPLHTQSELGRIVPHPSNLRV